MMRGWKNSMFFCLIGQHGRLGSSRTAGNELQLIPETVIQLNVYFPTHQDLPDEFIFRARSFRLAFLGYRILLQSPVFRDNEWGNYLYPMFFGEIAKNDVSKLDFVRTIHSTSGVIKSEHFIIIIIDVSMLYPL